MIKKILLVLLVGVLVHVGYQVFISYEITEGFSDDLDTLMLMVSSQTEESFKQQVVAQAERRGIHLTPEEISVRIEDTTASSLGSRVLGGTGAAVRNKQITLDFQYQVPTYGILLTHSVHRTKVFAAEIRSPSTVQEEQIRQAE